MPNTNVNFQMQQPNDMAMPQSVGVQQQNRLSLAERLRRYGLGQDGNPGQDFTNSFNKQMQPQGDGGQLNQGGSMQPGDANIRNNIMQNYNAPSGGSQAGYQLSAPMSSQRGMMGSMSRFGDQLQSGASSLGKGASSLGSSAMSAMRSF